MIVHKSQNKSITLLNGMRNSRQFVIIIEQIVFSKINNRIVFIQMNNRSRNKINTLETWLNFFPQAEINTTPNYPSVQKVDFL